jgi:hypothetical protein
MVGLGVDAHDAQRVEGLATDKRAFVLDEEEFTRVSLAAMGADPRLSATLRGFGTLVRATVGLSFGPPSAQEDGQRLMLGATDRCDFFVAGSH